MQRKTIQAWILTAAICLLMVAAFYGGAVTVCDKSEGFLLSDLRCIDLNSLDKCIFENQVYEKPRNPFYEPNGSLKYDFFKLEEIK